MAVSKSTFYLSQFNIAEGLYTKFWSRWLALKEAAIANYSKFSTYPILADWQGV